MSYFDSVIGCSIVFSTCGFDFACDPLARCCEFVWRPEGLPSSKNKLTVVLKLPTMKLKWLRPGDVEIICGSSEVSSGILRRGAFRADSGTVTKRCATEHFLNDDLTVDEAVLIATQTKTAQPSATICFLTQLTRSVGPRSTLQGDSKNLPKSDTLRAQMVAVSLSGPEHSKAGCLLGLSCTGVVRHGSCSDFWLPLIVENRAEDS